MVWIHTGRSVEVFRSVEVSRSVEGSCVNVNVKLTTCLQQTA